MGKKTVNKEKVVFEYFAPEAKFVAVSGTFNGWHPSRNLLHKYKDGKWKCSIPLLPGRYEYRYWVDGTWENDQRPVECIPNAFGTWNDVFEVR